MFWPLSGPSGLRPRCHPSGGNTAAGACQRPELCPFSLCTGWSFNLVPSLYGMAVLLHAKVTTLQFIFKNGHNVGSDYHFLMKLSGFLNYG